MQRLKYEFLLLVCAIIWGSAFVAQDLAMKQGLGPITFNALRFALGTFSLLPLIFFNNQKTPRLLPTEKFPYRACIGAGVLLFTAAGLQQTAMLTTTPANAGFITGFYILFVPLIGLFFHQKIHKSLWFGILICLIGFYFMSVTSQFVVARGDWLTLLSAIAFAGQITVIDHIAQKGDPLRMACIQYTICALLSLISSLIFERCTFAQIESAGWAIAYAGVISIGIAYTLQIICQKHCPPAPAAIIMSLEGVFAAISGFLILHQSLSSRTLSGCALILVGVIITQIAPMRKTISTMPH